MYEQEFQGDITYMMLYAIVAALNLVAGCYLLFRRGNAFAPDIKSPIRLRRWTGVFFTGMTLSHLWYMPGIYLTSNEDKMLCYDIGGMFDCMSTFPLAIVLLLTMLQDRSRPLWLAFVMVAPLEVRRYGRWLRDNYADLEHKEIWQSFVVLAVVLLGFGIYAFEIGNLANKYIVQVRRPQKIEDNLNNLNNYFFAFAVSCFRCLGCLFVITSY